jgi:hypothetical protein
VLLFSCILMHKANSLVQDYGDETDSDEDSVGPGTQPMVGMGSMHSSSSGYFRPKTAGISRKQNFPWSISGFNTQSKPEASISGINSFGDQSEFADEDDF